MIVYGNLVGAASGGNSKKPPEFTYTGVYELIIDEGVGWRIKFKTSGTFTLLKPDSLEIDAFLVGGGGGGGGSNSNGAGGGGGGGYITQSVATIYANKGYSISIGGGGNGGDPKEYNVAAPSGGTTSFGTFEALGGGGGYSERQGSYSYYGGYGGKGSHNGGNGGDGLENSATAGSNGVSSTKGEFGDSNAEKYAAGGGGGGGSWYISSSNSGGRNGGDGGTGGPNGSRGHGAKYTSGTGVLSNGTAPIDGIGGNGGVSNVGYESVGGGGGGGGGYGGGGGGAGGVAQHSNIDAKGYQGIVIIRNHREASK